MSKNTPDCSDSALPYRRFHRRPNSARVVPEPSAVQGARWIPLTKGKFALVDETDFAKYGHLTWTVLVTSSTCYAYCRRLECGKNRCYYLHRVIMDAPSGVDVDHVNGDGLDCRKSNMRLCSHKENLRNQRKRRGNYTSEYKGVSWDQSRNAWIAQFKADDDVRHIGRFESEDEAARAYDRTAIEHYGEFARLNFPEEVA
jgi:hypothetical protein